MCVYDMSVVYGLCCLPDNSLLELGVYAKLRSISCYYLFFSVATQSRTGAFTLNFFSRRLLNTWTSFNCKSFLLPFFYVILYLPFVQIIVFV